MSDKQQYVVLNPENNLYFTGYTGFGNQSQPMFGTLENAVEYDSQGEANAAAASIGGGTVGTTKPR